MPRALVVAADRALQDALATGLACRGYETCFARDAESALREAADVELVLWALPRAAGSAGPCFPGAQWVWVAPRGTGGADALALGADELLELPLDAAELALLLRRCAERARERRARRLLGRELRKAVGERPIVAATPTMIELLETLERVAAWPASVLLRGERGSGKESLARALHAFSPRRLEPFVALGCAEAGAAELERELFGRPGALPLEAPRPGILMDADGGTLFLDDAQALPTALQDRLAEVLRSEALQRPDAPKPRRLDLRVLAASPVDLEAEVGAGRFRQDLYERIANVTLDVPPLRERGLDLPLLVDQLLARACRRSRRPPLTLGDDALACLLAYPWPGNLPELESALTRAAARASGSRLGAEHLPAEIANPGQDAGSDLALRSARKRLEIQLIRRALRSTGGNRTHAARLLRISHRALLYKLKEHGLSDL
jgi:two-component system response regulator AtoC